MKSFYCDDNLLTTLNVDSMFNLQLFVCKNNLLTSLSVKNDIIDEFIDFSGNPGLTSICCDANEVVYMKNQCLLNDYNGTVVNSDCSTGSSKVAMYPNPVNDVLHLDSNKKITKIEIFAMNGIMVMNDELESEVVNLHQLESGMYIIKVYTDEEVTNMKFIKV